MDIGQCDSIVIILAPFTTTVPGLLSVYPVAIHRASLHKRRHGGGGQAPNRQQTRSWDSGGWGTWRTWHRPRSKYESVEV